MRVLLIYITCVFFASFCRLQAQSRLIYVTPGDKSLCPKDASTCQTLNWYNQNSNGSFMTNNTEVRFLSGTHVLNTTVAVINNCYNLTITGFENTNTSHDNKRKVRPVSLIDCKALVASGFKFTNSREILIKNIGLESCGAKVRIHNSEFNAALFFNGGSNIVLHRVVINNTIGYGLHIENILDSVKISESYFLRSSGTNSKSLVGNARFWFRERCEKTFRTNLMISSSWFMDGKRRSTGLELMIDTPNVHVEIEDVTIGNNHGGNLILIMKDYESSSFIKIRNCHINHGKAYEGGGLRFLFRTETSNLSMCTDTTIYKILDIYNTTFHNNIGDGTGGAVYMKSYQSGGYDCVCKMVKFSQCSFIKNTGNGAVVDISKHLTLAEHGSPPLNVSFQNCQFYNNSATSKKNGHVLNVIMGHISMSNCVFFGSKGTAVSLRKSNLNVYNTITFENNHARHGGALKVCEGSFVFLHKNTHIRFINNTAQMGGAIFIQEACLDTSPPCAFQPSLSENVSMKKLHKYLKLDFVNNSASTAGDALYGGSLDICYTIVDFSKINNTRPSFTFVDIIDEVFNMECQTGPSWIASDPEGVCFCSINETPQHYSCTKLHPVIEVYPGERFNISAVTVGQLNGVTFGSIHSSLFEEMTFHQLVVHDGEKYSNRCILLNYTLYTNKTNAIVILRPSVEDNDRADSINVTIRILPCPIGFELETDSEGLYTCKCSSTFQHTRYPWYSEFVQCDISTQLIHVQKRSTPVWIGCKASNSSLSLLTKNQSKCDVLQVSQSCDYYCSLSARNVSIFKLDEQCIHGRTGILCGKCKPGHSRTLGPYFLCKECSNAFLVEYIPSLLLSGVLIVFVLTVLNITVTEGTINGLILYATVLFRSHSNPQTYRHHVSKPMWEFIAWLNLESGNKDSCAYDGLTGYQYIWLNFGYVLYLLLIQVAIILLSRKFILFTRLIGKNVVKVLATLQFLTYSQLIYAIFHTFHFALVYESTQSGERSVRTVWHYDGNVQFLGLKHICLFIVAVICLLVTLFFVFCLLFIQCLQKISNLRCLHWVERMRPFFEAYTGPCNDNYRFWPGLLYLIRTIMYGVSMYFDGAEAHWFHFKMITISIFCVFMMFLACISPRGVYKKWPLNVLEFSFILNLCILCIALVVNHSIKTQYVTSITTAMLTTIGIILYHIYRQIKETRLCTKVKRLFSVCTRKICKRKYFKKSSERDPLLPQPLPTVVQFSEPLLID